MMSVSLSVLIRYLVKMAEYIVEILPPADSRIIIVFSGLIADVMKFRRDLNLNSDRVWKFKYSVSFLLRWAEAY